ncbi:MAG: SusC/RagA family TonB-linked outer membrane protein [Flavobacteriaceae bacterium]|nr:SusC/RagA family TonB-linked outer membrane protein [Flavobacteriaceae bacterium]
MNLNFLRKVVPHVLVLMMCTYALHAQRTISGTVTSADGPLPGASVVVQGTTIGTGTDFDGNFTIEVSDGDVLEFSFVGYVSQQVQVAGQDTINVFLQVDSQLEEVVVTGYGSQREREITSSVVKVTAEEFNRGPITNPSQLLQGKVAGLSIYNRGGNPNGGPTIRLRGLSTIGANVQPLFVIDGVIGASLNNVDPNDIETINVLKDGSAAAIYGSRGSSGVIIVTTKGGSVDEFSLQYNGQVGVSSILDQVDVMTSAEFKEAGGVDMGSESDWTDLVTRDALTQIHNVSASGGFGKTSFRIAANVREVEGIINRTGFNQFNSRTNINTKAFRDKLTIDFNSSYTKRNQDNGNSEVMEHATYFNPTAPVYFDDTPFREFFSQQQRDAVGGYFQPFGLFRSYNPVAITEQGRYQTEVIDLNYSVNANYQMTDWLSLTGQFASQQSRNNYEESRSTQDYHTQRATSDQRGNVAFENTNYSFTLYEFYGTLRKNLGLIDLTFTGGYSYQEEDWFRRRIGLIDFPNDNIDYAYNIGASEQLVEATSLPIGGTFSNKAPTTKIIAGFARLNLVIDNGIYFNASVRREGSTKLGEEQKWGVFPAVGLGADMNKYLGLSFDRLKFRVGYGQTGSLPVDSGLSQIVYNFSYGANGTQQARAFNPELKWESKAETNVGIEFTQGNLNATVDYYTREISDFLLEAEVDAAVFGFNRRWQNSGKMTTSGIELAADYNVNNVWSPGIVVSTYSSTLNEYIVENGILTGNLGSPGQNQTNMILVKPGEKIGQIWGPRFVSVDAEGNPQFEDVNGDGNLVTGQDKALSDDVDFEVLGTGIPTIEFGFSNNISLGKWNINAFFRGALGHSLVNTFRAFYEPRVGSQSSYNFINTKLAIPELKAANFSSLYVEKADFFKLDNLTVSYTFDIPAESVISAASVSANVQNAFVLSGYTGPDPEPSLTDGGNVLAPGIDRRNSYFTSRTFTLGLNIDF